MDLERDELLDELLDELKTQVTTNEFQHLLAQNKQEAENEVIIAQEKAETRNPPAEHIKELLSHW